jgi:hypothetical protein
MKLLKKHQHKLPMLNLQALAFRMYPKLLLMKANNQKSLQPNTEQTFHSMQEDKRPPLHLQVVNQLGLGMENLPLKVTWKISLLTNEVLCVILDLDNPRPCSWKG